MLRSLVFRYETSRSPRVPVQRSSISLHKALQSTQELPTLIRESLRHKGLLVSLPFFRKVPLASIWPSVL